MAASCLHRAQFAVIDPLFERRIADTQDLRRVAWLDQVLRFCAHRDGGAILGQSMEQGKYRSAELGGAKRRAQFLGEGRNDLRRNFRELHFGERRFRALQGHARKERILARGNLAAAK